MALEVRCAGSGIGPSRDVVDRFYHHQHEG